MSIVQFYKMHKGLDGSNIDIFDQFQMRQIIKYLSKQQHSQQMKYRAYILTFLAYVLMHCLRTGYSYSKPFFQTQFQLSNLFLAFLDFSIYFTMGIGFLTRYLSMHMKTMIRSFMIAGIIFSSAYVLFSVLAIINVLTPANAIPFSLILMIVFGFFQMHCWPVSLVIINDYFTNEEDGAEIAFWSSAGNLGNVFGFLIPSLMVVNAHLPWEVPQIFMGTALFITTVSVYLFVVRKKDLQRNDYLQLEPQPKTEEIGCNELIEGFKKYMSTMDGILLLINSCIYKAILYTFLLWLPTYMKAKVAPSQTAFMPIIFNIANTIGTSAFGKFYENSKNDGKNSYTCLLYLWPVLSIIITGGLIVFIKMSTYQPFLFTVVIILQGAIIGGYFSVFVGNQMIYVSEKNQNTLDIFTTITFGISSFAIAFTQLLIGIFMKDHASSQQGQYDSIFKVLLIMSIIGFCTMALRSWHILQRLKNEA